MSDKYSKKYIYEEKSSLSHYAADAFVVRCFDNRFWKVIKHFIKSQDLKHIDTESPAGGSKVFSMPENDGDREYMFRELEKSIKLHHVKKVMLFSHHDCGAYGGFVKFDNDPEKELQFHVGEHSKANHAIKARFPDIKVETYFIDEQGIVKTS